MNITRIIAVFSLITSVGIFVFWLSLRIPLPNDLLSQNYGQHFVDRYGDTLSITPSVEGQYVLPAADYSEVSLSFIEAILSVEDDNFFAHGAVDVPATIRAFFQNIFARRVVSGASTITQQLAKKILHNTDRTFTNKFREILLAQKLEAQFSKVEIFNMWANWAPFSANIVGINAASQYYFRKPPALLSLAQSAYLAGIPKNPTRYSPKKNPISMRERQRFTLGKMLENNFITDDQFTEAMAEEISPHKTPPPSRLTHLISYLRQYVSHQSYVQLTIDLGLQEKIEAAIKRHFIFLQDHNVHNAAVVVIENKNGAVRSYVGNTNLSSQKYSNQVDMLRSFRQVGSTLKPFVYYLAFRDLDWTPDTPVLDEPVSFQTSLGTEYSPKNFDLKYRGEITVRDALAQSRNIPAVTTLSKVGEEKFTQLLSSLGVEFLLRDNDSGLSAVLGSSEIRLLDLAKLYTILAREGEDVYFCYVGYCPELKGEQVLQREFVLELIDILSDNTARIPAFGEKSPFAFSFPVAAKTGTTRNFRDNYAVGFTTEFTVLVWVGNADGSPMKNVSGITGAGPLFHDVMMIISDMSSSKAFEKPKNRSGQSQKISTLRILSPLAHSQFDIDSSRPLSDQKISLRSTLEADFFIDGMKIGTGKEVFWTPKNGRHTLTLRRGGEQVKSAFTVGE